MRDSPDLRRCSWDAVMFMWNYCAGHPWRRKALRRRDLQFRGNPAAYANLTSNQNCCQTFPLLARSSGDVEIAWVWRALPSGARDGRIVLDKIHLGKTGQSQRYLRLRLGTNPPCTTTTSKSQDSSDVPGIWVSRARPERGVPPSGRLTNGRGFHEGNPLPQLWGARGLAAG